MSIQINLVMNDCPTLIDERTSSVGGSFWYDNPPRVYDPYIHAVCFDLLKTFPHAVLLDVGSSTGCYGLLAKHHPDLRVYSFEPVALSAEIQRENMKLNGIYDRVTVYETAISDYNGFGTFHQIIPIGGLGVSQLDGTPHHDKLCEKLEKPVMTIDLFCNQNDVKPNMIKIDVEGNELAVLKGAEITIRKHHPILIVEVEVSNTNQYGYDPSEIVNWIRSAGYEISYPHSNSDLLAIWRG